MTTLIEEANLEIEKAKQISNSRGEAFSVILQSFNEIAGKFSEFEGRISGGGNSANFKGEFDAFRGLLTMNRDRIAQLGSNAPMKDLHALGNGILFEHQMGVDGSFTSSVLPWIYESTDNNVYVRMQSSFRALEKENELLRDKYIKWQTARPNIHGVEDRDRIIDTLEKRIVELSSEINRFKSQSSVSVNVIEGNRSQSGNNQELDLQIRNLSAKNRDLESQLRNLSLNSGSSQDNDSQIRNLNNKIRDLESQLRNQNMGSGGSSQEN